MKGICHLRSRGRHFSPSLPGDRYLKLGSKSDLRAEISGSIVWYDALAPRPEVLLLWYFIGACAATLKLKLFPYSWRKYLHRDDLRQHPADVIYRSKYKNRPYSYSQYWTGTSLQWRLMRGNILKIICI